MRKTQFVFDSQQMRSPISINTEEFADTYNKPDWWFRFRYDTQHKIKTALYVLSKGGVNVNGLRILEYGFGSGELLFRFPRSCSINGIEVSTSAVSRATTRALKLGYQSFSFELLDDSTAATDETTKYDLIVASHVLEHLENPFQFLDDINKKLKDHGYLVILIPINERYKDPKHAQSYSTETCLDLLKSKGFKCLFQVENDGLFYLVENLYFRNYSNHWNFFDNLKRIIFNFTFAPLPFWLISFLEKIFFLVSKLPPRQSVFLLSKNE